MSRVSYFLAASLIWLLTPTLIAQPTDAPGVTVDTGGALLMHRTAVPYPETARSSHIEGIVSIQVSLDPAGNVNDARVITGPLELRRAALQSVLQWHFARDAANGVRQVNITFQATPPESAPAPPPRAAVPFLIPRQGDAPDVGAYITQLRAGTGGALRNIVVSGLPDQIRDQLVATLPVHQGDPLTAETMDKIRNAVKQFDEHLSVTSQAVSGSESDLRILAPGVPFVAPAASNAVPGQVKVSTGAPSPPLVRSVPPVYPVLAKQARIQGVVKLNAVIGKDGTVQDLKSISGHPLLVPAAIEAVKQWVYQPTLLNGAPVDVTTEIQVNFTLADQ